MAKSNKNINCIIYARLSQEDGYNSTSVSIENQISICKDYANENGLIITKILLDKLIYGQTMRVCENLFQETL